MLSQVFLQNIFYQLQQPKQQQSKEREKKINTANEKKECQYRKKQGKKSPHTALPI
jgi:ribosomal protein L21